MAEPVRVDFETPPEGARNILDEAAPPEDVRAALLAQSPTLNQGLPPIRQTQEVNGLWDAWRLGWQESVSGLRIRGKSPELMLGEDASRGERIMSQVAMVLGDAPTLAVGGVFGGIAGTAGGPVGTAAGVGAGAMGLTEGMRRWMLEEYRAGQTKADVVDRLVATGIATSKGAVIGAATGGVGGKVAQLTARGAILPGQLPGLTAQRAVQPRFGPFGQNVLTGGAEIGTMVGVASALEREIPDADDFIDAAILIGGIRTTIGTIGGVTRRAEQRRERGLREEAIREAREKLERDFVESGRHPRDVVDELGSNVELSNRYLGADEAIVPFDKLRPIDSVSPLAIKPGRTLPKDADPRLERAARNPVRDPFDPKDRPREQLNLDTFDMADGPASLSRALAEQFANEIREQGAAPRTIAQIEADAGAWLRDVLGRRADRAVQELFEKGSVEYAAELRARKEIAQLTLEEAWKKAEEVAANGKEATTLEVVEMLASVERAERAQRIFRGQTAEVGRALRILQEKRRVAEIKGNEKEVLDMLARHGGEDAARQLALMLSEATSVKSVARLTSKATFADKVIEFWKSGLVSAGSTIQVNLFGNIGFGLYRSLEMAVAAPPVGIVRNLGRRLVGLKATERAELRDAMYHLEGWLYGTGSALTLAYQSLKHNMDSASFGRALWNSYKQIETPKRAETGPFRKAIEGNFGEVVRAGFKPLALGDIAGRHQMYNASMHMQAARVAQREGLKPGTPEHRVRMEEIKADPHGALSKKKADDLVKVAEEHAERFRFLEDGPWIDALERFRDRIKVAHGVFPFIKTMLNIFKETTRRTPAAGFVRQWRADVKAGGPTADRAIGEMLLGTGFAVTMFALSRDGVNQGGGHPDPKQRQADYNAGYLPYSWKLADGRQLQYSRFEPLGTIMGMAADISTAWDLMTKGEQEDAASALTWAFMEGIRNKTWVRGAAEFVNFIGNPERYGESYLENLTRSAVPGFIGETARELDPYQREVNSILDALKARIPGIRESLMPRRNPMTGDRIKKDDAVPWPTFPIRTRQMTKDIVLLEAQRLGVAMPRTGTKMSVGSIGGETLRVEITPQQRDKFVERAGRLSHEAMLELILSPQWGQIPDLAKMGIFRQVFRDTREHAAFEVLPPDKREQMLRVFEAELEAEGLLD